MLADRVRMGSGFSGVIGEVWGPYRNLSLEGVASVSGGANPQNAIDGVINDSSRWITPVTGPHWLEIDLGKECKINKIDYYNGANNGTTHFTPVYTFQYWSGVEWVDIISVEGNEQHHRTHIFNDVLTNKIRLIFPEQNETQRVYEVEIYGVDKILPINEYLYFSGSGDFVKPYNFPLMTEVFAMCFHMKVEGTTSHAWIASNRTTATNGFSVFLLSGSELVIDFGSSGASSRWRTGYHPPTDKWVHITFIRTPSYAELLIDGELYSTMGALGSVSNPSEEVFIGRNNTGSYFKGGLYNISIWDVVPSPDDISKSKNAELTGGELGLRRYWRFDSKGWGYDVYGATLESL